MRCRVLNHYPSGLASAYYLTEVHRVAVILLESRTCFHAASGNAGGFLAKEWFVTDVYFISGAPGQSWNILQQKRLKSWTILRLHSLQRASGPRRHTAHLLVTFTMHRSECARAQHALTVLKVAIFELQRGYPDPRRRSTPRVCAMRFSPLRRRRASSSFESTAT